MRLSLYWDLASTISISFVRLTKLGSTCFSQPASANTSWRVWFTFLSMVGCSGPVSSRSRLPLIRNCSSSFGTRNVRRVPRSSHVRRANMYRICKIYVKFRSIKIEQLLVAQGRMCDEPVWDTNFTGVVGWLLDLWCKQIFMWLFVRMQSCIGWGRHKKAYHSPYLAKEKLKPATALTKTQTTPTAS